MNVSSGAAGSPDGSRFSACLGGAWRSGGAPTETAPSPRRALEGEAFLRPMGGELGPAVLVARRRPLPLRAPHREIDHPVDDGVEIRLEDRLDVHVRRRVREVD